MTKLSPDCPVVTVGEAANLLRINLKTLYAEIAADRFPAIRLGRVLRFAHRVLASILEQTRVAPLGGIQSGMQGEWDHVRNS